MSDAVDFPDFVSNLIDGVFISIVDASIKQMEAFAKLLEQVRVLGHLVEDLVCGDCGN